MASDRSEGQTEETKSGPGVHPPSPPLPHPPEITQPARAQLVAFPGLSPFSHLSASPAQENVIRTWLGQDWTREGLGPGCALLACHARERGGL